MASDLQLCNGCQAHSVCMCPKEVDIKSIDRARDEDHKEVFNLFSAVATATGPHTQLHPQQIF